MAQESTTCQVDFAQAVRSRRYVGDGMLLRLFLASSCLAGLELTKFLCKLHCVIPSSWPIFQFARPILKPTTTMQCAYNCPYHGSSRVGITSKVNGRLHCLSGIL